MVEMPDLIREWKKVGYLCERLGYLSTDKKTQVGKRNWTKWPKSSRSR